MDNDPPQIVPPPIVSNRPVRKLSGTAFSLAVIYAVVLAVSLFTVYVLRGNQLDSVKAQLAAAQSDKQKSSVPEVDSSEFQAVFLSSGQAYFGKLESVNDNYVKLTDVFYLNGNGNVQSDTSSNTATSLVKLGCELHGPEDEMVISRDKVNFWENMKPSSHVAQAISTFEKQNPNGQRCSG